MKRDCYYYVAHGKWIPLGKDLSIAKMKWAELEGVANNQTFNSALDKYLISTDFTKLAPNTQRSYQGAAKKLRDVFGRVSCKNITSAHIYQYLDQHPSKAVANIGLVVIKQSLEKARRYGWIQVNPANDIEKHTLQGRKRYLEDTEYQAIYKNASDTLKSIMTLAYLSGQRPIDIRKIEMSDIRDDGLYIHQQKTGAKQLFMWTDDLREAIRKAKEVKGIRLSKMLFVTVRGVAVSETTLWKWWKEACAKAGIKEAQFRDIRAKSATDAENEGQDYQAILGHTSKAMSDKYVKRFKTQKVQPLQRKI
jgi:integrase